MLESTFSNRSLISDNIVKKILDFGQHPFADTFVSKKHLNVSEPVYPLEVYLDEETGMIQLGYISNASSRYNLFDYSYTSANSKYSRQHWTSFYTDMLDTVSPDGLVIEIGSNDGYLIKKFDMIGLPTIGIDSSKYMCDMAERVGVTCVNEVFNEDLAHRIKYAYAAPPAKLIIANNVFNHANDPVDFARGVASLLHDDGMFVFELPYWKDSVVNRRLDQVYHEHITYFTVTSAYNLLKKAGLHMVDFDTNGYHGGSLRVFARKGSGDRTEKIQRQMILETSEGLFNLDFYEDLRHDLTTKRSEWLRDFYTIRASSDVPIIGVGAAAKANTWLNWYGLDRNDISFVTDSSPHKQGKYTPLSRIPIVGDEVFAEYDNPYALILSWNISDTLKDILLDINPTVRFLTQ